jgi:WhiB family transcriptional regulator, redox-sensing transcriptional regulator
MEWRDQSACREVDPELFFPLTASGPSQFQIAKARAVCATCVVRLQCLNWSLDNDVTHGVWGGLSENERHDLLRARRRSDANQSVSVGAAGN